LPAGLKYIYYPLHVPADFALTIRSLEYLDQYSFLDYAAKVTPVTHRLLIKEHPAHIGGLDSYRIRQLLKQNDNLWLVDPRVNNFDVMQRAEAVLTINSKSGAEALLLGKPCIVLGDAFYRGSRLVRPIDSLRELEPALAEALRSGDLSDQESIERFFQNVWDSSYPGELFDCTEANIVEISRSIQRCLQENRVEQAVLQASVGDPLERV